jgi:tartrate dehydrogenase/decarboxylase/D-malate dehydrogenase
MNSFDIAAIPGDGIGKEVIPAALTILKAAGTKHGFRSRVTTYDWSCERYARTGRLMPVDGISRLRDHDAILLGAVGSPEVPDHVSLWGLLIPIRRGLQQYISLRPVRLLPGVTPPVNDTIARRGINMWIVRENSEGEYSQVGGRFGEGTEGELVAQTAIFTRAGTDRVIRYAFNLARSNGSGHVTSATKSNGIYYSMPYWDERFAEIAKEFPDVRADQFHIDILAARFVMTPHYFDVVVASNLFGDILSDLGPGVTGTIGVAPSANLNPERDFPSMFEPVHGSAPDIAGRGIANPIGAIWAAAMMLDHLGQREAAADVLAAIESTLSSENPPLTPDLGGRAGTGDLTSAILGNLMAG